MSMIGNYTEIKKKYLEVHDPSLSRNSAQVCTCVAGLFCIVQTYCVVFEFQICVPMSVEFEELMKARDNPSEEAQSKILHLKCDS